MVYTVVNAIAVDGITWNKLFSCCWCHNEQFVLITVLV